MDTIFQPVWSAQEFRQHYEAIPLHAGPRTGYCFQIFTYTVAGPLIHVSNCKTAEQALYALQRLEELEHPLLEHLNVTQGDIRHDRPEMDGLADLILGPGMPSDQIYHSDLIYKGKKV